jgi:hypothetical protein
MPTVHYATYTNSAGDVTVLNTGTAYRFAPGGLPTNCFGLPFSAVNIEIPANDPAEAYQTHLYQPREIEMRLWVLGNSPSEMLTLAAQLYNDLTYDVWAKRTGVFTYTADNGLTRSIKCVLANIGDLEDWLNRYHKFLGRQDTRAQIPLKLRCPSPCWYDPTENTYSGTFNGSTPVAIACANSGQVEAYPRITYTGAVTNPAITASDGRVFNLTLTVAAGGVVAIDFDPFAFTCTHTPSGGAATDVRNLQSLVSREITVAGGSGGTLSFVSSAASTAAITVALNARYRGHGYQELGA